MDDGDGWLRGGRTLAAAVIDFVPTTSSIVESIGFYRVPGTCEHGGHHHLYRITWTNLDGLDKSGQVYWCDHPFCDTSPFRLGAWPEVKLTAWVQPVANAYLLATFDPEGRTLPKMVARVGIVDQWQSREFGNYGEDWERRLFTERYFAESGPGVYPATIIDV